MRIIAGKFRGRTLIEFEAEHIRPTSDRVKESLFNILGPAVRGARVLDLFAGTGNLSIESVSRGAAQVEAVELNKKSIIIIRKNLTKFDLKSEVKIHAEDVFKFLKRHRGGPFDFVLADPPFTEMLAHEVLGRLTKSSAVGPQTLVAIESSSRERLDETYGDLTRIDKRSYGDKILSFFQRKGSA